MNLTGYAAVCDTLNRRGYGSDAPMVFEEMLRVDRTVRGSFMIERTLCRDGLMDMVVSYDSAKGWNCRTNWLASAHLRQESVSACR